MNKQFLDSLIGKPISILTNSNELFTCVLVSHDNYTLLLSSDAGVKSLFFKHSIQEITSA